MFQIVLNGPGYLDTRYELPVGDTLLGRADDNHVVLSGDGVSRHHARLIRERERLKLEDLGSRNGTLLNGHPIVGAVPLRAGDRIMIGENQLSIEAMLATSDVTTVVLRRPVDEMESLSRLQEARALDGSGALGAGAALEPLALLSLVSERLALAPSLDAFLGDVSGLVLELARAQTVVVLLRDDAQEPRRSSDEGAPRQREPAHAAAEEAFTDGGPSLQTMAAPSLVESGSVEGGRAKPRIGAALLHDTQEASPRAKAGAGTAGASREPLLLPAAIRHLGDRLEGRVPISWSIVHQCVSERVALCVADASADPRFADRESVIAHGVHQAICVPLLRDRSVVGVLYVNRLDNDAPLAGLLEALTAIAHLAATGIEQQKLKDRAEREVSVRRRLARFLAPDIAEEVLRERGGSLGMEERFATVIFADISGFTAFTEKAPAEQVVALLDEFYRRMTAIVFEHRGTVDKFIGDAVMAVFGAPYSRIDDADRALLAALSMRDSFGELMAEWPEGQRCSLKIGLNTGRLFAGTVGGERLEYTLVGDAVNVASRLVTLAEPGQILAAHATLEATGRPFDTVSLGERTLRGRSAPVSIFEVRGEGRAAGEREP